jgi:hypothetical protein
LISSCYWINAITASCVWSVVYLKITKVVYEWSKQVKMIFNCVGLGRWRDQARVDYLCWIIFIVYRMFYNICCISNIEVSSSTKMKYKIPIIYTIFLSFTLSLNTIQHQIISHNTIPQYTILYHSIARYTTLYTTHYTITNYTKLYHTIPSHSYHIIYATLYNTVPYCTTTLYYTKQYQYKTFLERKPRLTICIFPSSFLSLVDNYLRFFVKT